MSHRFNVALLAATALAVSLAAPASAQLIQRKDLSLTVALGIANGALEACKTMGYAASVVVVVRDRVLTVHDPIRGEPVLPGGHLRWRG